MIKRFLLFYFLFSFFVLSSPLSIASTTGSSSAASGKDDVAVGSGAAASLVVVAPVADPAPIPIDIVNPCSDFGFKRAFKDPQVAMGFLNTILSLAGGDAITDLRYIDTELPSLAPEGRDFRVDVLCRSSKGERFLLEMQNDYRADYPDKALVEFCRLMGHVDAARYQSCSRSEDHESGGSGSAGGSSSSTAPPPRKRIRISKDFWQDVPRIITLVITNKKFIGGQKKERFPDQDLMEPNIINTYTLRHTERPDRRLGNIDARIVLVMLANFTKPIGELGTDMDKWLFSLKDENLSTGRKGMDTYKHVTSLAAVEGDNPSLKRFYQLLNKTGIAADELRRYEEGIVLVNGEMERRYSEGHAAGIAEGRKAGLLQAARVMKGLKTMTNASIATKLGLEEAEVASIEIDEAAS